MAITTVHGVCPHDCYDACGLTVTTQDGQIRAIKGDSDHPITRGFLCFKVNHYLDRMNHPDRITKPFKRVGPKGSGKFREVSWDEALAEAGARLKTIAAQLGGEAILPYTFAGNEGILTDVMATRFFRLMGASILDRTICTAASDAALAHVYGTALGPDPETLPRAKLVILWGSNPLATNVHAVPLLDEARRRGGEVWTIDPLKTATAARYDYHVALKPDSDYALALGLAHALIEQGAHDQPFIDQYVSGFEHFVQQTEPWTRARTLAATGVPEALFDLLVHRLAERRPLLFRTGWGLQRHRDGAEIIWAIAALSLILGTPKEIGGGFLSSNSGAFPLNREALYDVGVRRDTRHINMVKLGEALNQVSNPPIAALIVWQSNPAATAPDQRAVLRGLGRSDLLTIVHEQMWTDTARWADFVFPAALSVETLDLYVSYWHRYIQLNQPAAPPQGESVSNNEFFRRLARAVGLDAEAFAATDQILIEQALQVDHDWLEGIDWRSLSELPRQKVKLGADRRPLIDTPIPTPDGRFHIEPMATRPPDGPVQLDEDELWLLSPSRRETIKSSYGNVASVIKAGEPELLVHPDDMRRLGLREGQWVTVYNQLGETRMRAWGSPVPQPGTVVSYAVRWNQAARGSNVNQLTPAGVSTIGQGATFYDARVRIRS